MSSRLTPILSYVALGSSNQEMDLKLRAVPSGELELASASFVNSCVQRSRSSSNGSLRKHGVQGPRSRIFGQTSKGDHQDEKGLSDRLNFSSAARVAVSNGSQPMLKHCDGARQAIFHTACSGWTAGGVSQTFLPVAIATSCEDFDRVMGPATMQCHKVLYINLLCPSPSTNFGHHSSLLCFASHTGARLAVVMVNDLNICFYKR